MTGVEPNVQYTASILCSLSPKKLIESLKVGHKRNNQKCSPNLWFELKVANRT